MTFLHVSHLRNSYLDILEYFRGFVVKRLTFCHGESLVSLIDIPQA